MTRQGYDQICAAATALDVVGERWALLLVRDLLLGPLRYGDLMAGLPGISTSVLAARLSELESAGVLRRRLLGRPGNAVVYELTERGGELEPVVLALAAWGKAHVPPSERPGRQSRPTVAGLLLRESLRAASPQGGLPKSDVELWVGEWPLAVSLHDVPDVHHGEVEPGPAAATVRLTAATFYALLSGRATWPKDAAAGDAQAITRIRQALESCASSAA